MQSKSQLVNTNENWNTQRRYKINASVNYDGGIYQNSTGSNSIPTSNIDWIFLKSNSNSNSLSEQIEFIATGGETSHDIGTFALVKSWFWDGSPQAKSQWSQAGSVLTFAFPLSAGSFNIFI